MALQFGQNAGPVGHVLTAQRVLRVMTILVMIFGGGYLVYLKFFAAPKHRPAPEPASAAQSTQPAGLQPGEVEYTINVEEFLRGRGDNAPASQAAPAKGDNATAAIVGLDAVKDGALIEPQPLYWLLREVEDKYPADDVFMKRAPMTSLEELKAKPQDFRGKPVAVRGSIVRVERSSLPENPSGIRVVLDGDIVDPAHGMCSFLTTRIVPVANGSTVELRGLFMKLVSYKTMDGRTELVPLVLVSQPLVVRAAPASGNPGSGGPSWLISILVLLFVGYIALQFALRRKGAATNRAVDARRRAREMLGSSAHDPQDLTPPTDPAGGPPA